ncbi:MAG: hypothetical protein K8S16_14430, partial [Bacteroidales bacterium]|nr:hypothetical protein [Bacteroidales bacterium]
MKQFLLIGLLSVVFSTTHAGVLEQSYYFDDYSIHQQDNYQLIGFKGLLLTGKTGEPALPYQDVKLLLPPGELAVSVEI